jgi:hypothetical protein
MKSSFWRLFGAVPPIEKIVKFEPFDRIDWLVSERNFFFQSWGDRYGSGVWVAIALSRKHIDIVREFSRSGGLDMFMVKDYTLHTDWLPFVLGGNLADGMHRLEERLAQLDDDQLCHTSEWSAVVTNAMQSFYDAMNGRSCYDEDKPELPETLPKTFDLALKRFSASGAERFIDNNFLE